MKIEEFDSQRAISLLARQLEEEIRERTETEKRINEILGTSPDPVTGKKGSGLLGFCASQANFSRPDIDEVNLKLKDSHARLVGTIIGAIIGGIIAAIGTILGAIK